MSPTEIIEKILKDEFPEMQNAKANRIANRIQDALEEFTEENNHRTSDILKKGTYEVNIRFTTNNSISGSELDEYLAEGFYKIGVFDSDIGVYRKKDKKGKKIAGFNVSVFEGTKEEISEYIKENYEGCEWYCPTGLEDVEGIIEVLSVEPDVVIEMDNIGNIRCVGDLETFASIVADDGLPDE